jgi:hypothetical protein
MLVVSMAAVVAGNLPMSKLQLNAIATRLLLDDEFQRALLDERRGECLVPFKLTDWERSAILSIKARSPRSFIGELRNLANRYEMLPATAIGSK